MVVVVLPTFNEEQAIKPLLDHLNRVLKEHFPEYSILVVNDGSVDRTAQIVRSYQGIKIELLEHEFNKGLSEAVKTGLLHAVKITKDSDVIVVMDADNTHSPGLILRMAMLIEEGNDVVIASRYLPGARVYGLSLYRRFYSYLANLLYRTLFPIRGVRDYTCGYRAYQASILKEAFKHWGGDFINMPGFASTVDIILKLGKLNAIITEVPLILRYDLKPGKSKMNVRKTIADTLYLSFKRLFSPG